MTTRGSEAAAPPVRDLLCGFRLGTWTVEPASGVVRSADGEARLMPQPMAVLVLLARHAGEIVSKEEIFETVWAGTAVESVALPRCISEIRKALGDDARQPRYIQTVPKRGYRLLPSVSVPKVSAEEPIEVATAPETPPATEPTPWLADRKRLTVLLVAVAVLLTLWGLRGRGPRAALDASNADGSMTAEAPAIPRIAVLGIEALSDDPDTAWLSSALAAMLTTELAVSDQLRAIPEAAIWRLRHELAIHGALDAPTAQRLMTRLGADYGVLGTFLETSESPQDTLRLDLRVHASGSDEILAAVVVTGSVETLADTALMAGMKLRRELGLGRHPANEHRLADTPGPTDPAAARLYYRGLHLQRRFDAQSARSLFERSIAAASTNPHARVALAQTWATLGYDARAAAEARTAITMIGAVEGEDRLWIEAQAHTIAGQWAEAIEDLEALWRVSVHNLEYGHALARAQLRAGRPRDAQETIAALERDVPRDSRDPRLTLLDGEASQLLGEPQRAREAARTARSRAEALGATLIAARALVLEAEAANLLGHGDAGETLLIEAAERFAAAGDRAAVARTNVTLAQGLERRGMPDRAEALERASWALFTEIGDRSGEASTMCRLATHVWNREGRDAGEAMFRRAIEIFREIGDPMGEADALNWLANSTTVHRAGPNRPLYERALAIYRAIGDKHGQSKVLMNLGSSAYFDLELTSAVSLLTEAASVQRQLGLREHLGLTLHNLGQAQLLRGELDAATETLREALRLFRDVDNPRMQAGSLCALAKTRLEADDPRSALDHLEPCVALRTELGVASRTARAISIRARAEEALGRFDEAERSAREALALAGPPCSVSARGAVMTRLADTLLTIGKRPQARDTVERLIEENRAFTPSPATLARRRLTIARVFARTGALQRASQNADAVRSFAIEKGAELLRLESELIRAELAAQGYPIEPPVDPSALLRDAERLGLHRIARLAREHPRATAAP